MAKTLASQYGYSTQDIEKAMSSYSATNNGNGQPSESQKGLDRNKMLYRDEQMNHQRNMYIQYSMDSLEFVKKNISSYDTKSNIYGHQIFKHKNVNFMPNYNIPTPNNYKLLAGDELILDVWGALYKTENLFVSPEGSVTIPEYGPVYVSGLSVEQAQKLFERKLSTIYSGISGDKPTTFLRLSLGKIRSISINVVGDVQKPGSYTLPSLSDVSAALYKAEGPSDIGSVRNIFIYRNSKLIKTYDLYNFIFNGDFSNNIRLEDNDLIVVSSFENVVKVSGAVKRPMKYEMVNGETFSSLLKYSGGFASDANRTQIYVERVYGDKKEAFTVNQKEFSSFKLENGDSISVSNNFKGDVNNVSISGAIMNPGSYGISESLNMLSHLIKAAGGVNKEAYMDRAYIKRLDDSKNLLSLNFSISEVMSGINDIPLKNADSVIVFAKNELIELSTVTISGEVNNPDTFDYRDGMTLGDLILLSNGYTNGAVKYNIELARRNFTNSQRVSDTITNIITLNLDSNPNDINYKLMPYDMIYIRKNPNFKHQQPVSISGEVIFPGTYVIENNVVRLSDVIKRAGGLSSDAYIQGATLRRKLTQIEFERMVLAVELAKKQVKDSDSTYFDDVDRSDSYSVGINLEEALKNPGSILDPVLSSNDVVNIPKMNNTVRISGGVLYPNTVSYDPDMRYKDYIEMAGGYVKNAMKKKSYIVYMNGTVSTRGSSKFKVRPGSEIIVPVKDINTTRKMSAAEIMSIASSTASVATMVVSMVNLLK